MNFLLRWMLLATLLLVGGCASLSTAERERAANAGGAGDECGFA